MEIFKRTLLLLSAALVLSPAAIAQTTLSDAADDGAVVATVASEPIAAGEVRRVMYGIFRDKQPTGTALAVARAQVLEEIITRRLVLAYALRTGEMPGAEALAAAKAQFKKQLAARRVTLEEWQKAEGLSDFDFQRQLTWNVAWEKFIGRYCTTERREAYFAAHRRDLDGTELVVSHLLLRPAPNAGPEAIADLMKKSEAIRGEIVAGRLTFAAAAERYSQGPSRSNGGKLGRIGRRGPMEEAFTRAAYELKAGDVSAPVRTPYGVDLIRCDEVVPGEKKLTDVQPQIDDSLGRELLEKLAQIERKYTTVKYTPGYPHFQPGTKNLSQ